MILRRRDDRTSEKMNATNLVLASYISMEIEIIERQSCRLGFFCVSCVGEFYTVAHRVLLYAEVAAAVYSMLKKL